nr:MAG: ORF1 [Torque teno midi virus]
MALWWRRRRKFWWGRRKNNFRKKRYYTTRKRTYRRRRNRWPTRRRRRRRRKKVRRKRQTIPIRQWQPDSITKCKIIGFNSLVLGAQGRQYICYTNVAEDYVPPKAPGGGGFGAELYSLQYLYEQYVFHRNVWTKTNVLKDLCRFLRCKLVFFRAPETDFVVAYERQPPFHIEKFTYTNIHPQQLLLQKHHKVILSEKTKPRGKISTKMIIKPPKQMLSKWFFTDQFCQFPLFFLKGSAANFRYPNIGCCNTSQQVNINYLNLTFYAKTNWGVESSQTTPYQPTNSPASTYNFKYKKGNTTADGSYSKPNTYTDSVNYTKGWFNSTLLNAIKFTTPAQASLPISYGRYNPQADTGEHNKIYFVSIVKQSPIQPSDPVLIMQGAPLWLMLYGFSNYVLLAKKDKTFLSTHYIVLESPAIYIYQTSQTKPQIIPVDSTFINGQPPYGEYLLESMKTNWYPTFKHQVETINAIVETGPYIPKLSQVRNSTWELNYKYFFYFKWGGPQTTEKEVVDPSKLPSYDVPDRLKPAIQITNPAKQHAASYLHAWDIRRGIATKKALKRMSDNIETDSSFCPDTEIPQKRKRVTNQLRPPQEEEEEIQDCLLSLCEENICQEPKEENLLDLIKQQQQQQHQLKYNILALLSSLKSKQRMLQLQTGILE